MKYMHGVDKNAYVLPDEVVERHIEFEKKVMKFILDGTGEVFDILREQYSKATVVKREFTGVGFFTEFEILGEYKKVSVSERNFGDVYAVYKIPDGRTGADFIVWIEDNKIDTLEGVTFDEEWSYDYDNYVLKHDK